MRALWQMPELQEIWNHIETGETPVTVTGLSPVHRAQLAAALLQRQLPVGIKRTVNIGHYPRLSVAAPLVCVCKAKNGYIIFDRIVKRIVGERADTRVVGPDVRLGIYEYRRALANAFVYDRAEIARRRNVVGQRKRAYVRRYPPENGH